MRWLFLLTMALTSFIALGDETQPLRIAGVLARSQQMQLDALALAEPASPRAARVAASFTRVVREAQPPDVDLRVIRGALVAETLHGHVVVANESLADLTEGQRRFILAHEMGHVVLGHWAQMVALYERWIPGEVTKSETDPVAARLGREASALAHRQEFEADAFGVKLLLDMGFAEDDAVTAFMSLGVHKETATHPGTMRRVAALRAASGPSLQAAVSTATR